MSKVTSKVRIYELAKELKVDVKEVRTFGVRVSVPSNAISKGLAELIRNAHSSAINGSEVSKHAQIRVIRGAQPPTLNNAAAEVTKLRQAQQQRSPVAVSEGGRDGETRRLFRTAWKGPLPTRREQEPVRKIEEIVAARNQDHQRVRGRRPRGQKLTLAQQYDLIGIGSSSAKCPYCRKVIDLSVYEGHTIQCQIERESGKKRVKRRKLRTSNVKRPKAQKSKKLSIVEASSRSVKRHGKEILVSRQKRRRLTRRSTAVGDRRYKPTGKGPGKKIRIVQGGLPTLGKRK